MEEIIQMLQTDVNGALKLLTASQKDKNTIEDAQKEYRDLDRTIRDTQVGKIQKDKTVGSGEKRRLVKGVRTIIPFQSDIVGKAVAFEVGEPVTLIPSDSNNLSEEVLRLWRVNRIDAKLSKAKELQKSELQCAFLFYIEDLKPNNMFNRIVGANKNKDIKVRVLENKNGIMTPYFDEGGDMTAFVWEYTTKNVSGKEIKHVWIYDETKVYQCSNITGSLKLNESLDHGFGKIPIVYLSQDKPEWYKVQNLIDRLETSVSKHGASNDYAGHPILKLYGEVEGAPEKDEDGKAFFLSQKETTEGKVISSDVDFLTHDNAPQSVSQEQDRLEKYIYQLSSTPNLSFESLKGLGNGLSGKVLKMLLIDPILKAKRNEGENRTMIERIINVLIAGTVNTTNTGMKSFSEKTWFDVQFNSVVPDDTDIIVTYITKAYQAGLISQKTSVELLAFVEDAQEEIDQINAEKTAIQPKNIDEE